MAHFAFLAAVASAAFLLLAARWLLVLRRTALDAKLPLTPLDKFIAAAPVGYTVFCMVSAGLLADRFDYLQGMQDAAVSLPLVGSVDHAFALWLTGLLTGLAMATPPIVVFTVETHFGRRLPELVKLGRQAVWAMVTGVSVGRSPPAKSAEEDEDALWKELVS